MRIFTELNKEQRMSILVVAILAAAFIVYRFYFYSEPIREPETLIQIPAEFRPYSSVITYDIPGNKTHTIDFTIYLDDNDLIKEFKFTDTTDPEHQGNVDKFSAALLTEVQGKNIRDIGPIDKIGTSSLTTDAFNKALAEIKTQL